MFVADVKHRCLSLSIPPKFFEIMLCFRFWFFLFSLAPPLSFVSLFLLARLLLLAFGETRSTSWHTCPPFVSSLFRCLSDRFFTTRNISAPVPWDHARVGPCPAGRAARAHFGVVAGLFSSSRLRFRRAIFCLRSRWNRDLSPLRADIMNSSDMA